MRSFIIKRETRADSGRESLVDEIDATSTRIVRGIANRALLDIRRGARNTDYKMTEAKTVSHLSDKRPQHFPRDFEVVDGAAANWPVYFDTTRLAAKKLECLVTNANDLAIVAIERHD